jgi:hypothetical protein
VSKTLKTKGQKFQSNQWMFSWGSQFCKQQHMASCTLEINRWVTPSTKRGPLKEFMTSACNMPNHLRTQSGQNKHDNVQ